jgi:hypothetical protein
MAALAEQMLQNSMLRMLSHEYNKSPDLILTDADRAELTVFIMREYQHLRDVGISVVLSDANPYATHAEMRRDVLVNHRLKVFIGGTDSPVLSHHHNVMFRAIHDYHHIVCGSDFTLKGEIRTWRYVASLLQNLTLKKFLFSEIVLQAATAIKTGKFPVQRIVDSSLIHQFA